MLWGEIKGGTVSFRPYLPHPKGWRRSLSGHLRKSKSETARSPGACCSRLSAALQLDWRVDAASCLSSAAASVPWLPELAHSSLCCLEQSGFFREGDGSRHISQGPQRESEGGRIQSWKSATALVAQCERTHLPMPETQAGPLAGRTPRPRGQLHPCTTTTEPVVWSPRAAATEAQAPRSNDLPQRSPTVRSRHAPAGE